MSTQVAIIGISGSGKTTCLRETLKILGKETSVAGICDEILLAETEPSRRKRSNYVPWAATKLKLASLAWRTRSRAIRHLLTYAEMLCTVRVRNAIVRKYNPTFVITEGSPLMSVAGLDGLRHLEPFEPAECARSIRYLCREERIPLSKVRHYLGRMPGVLLTSYLRLAKFSRPDVTFFLYVDPDVALERLAHGAPVNELDEDRESLSRLQRAYETACNLVSTEFKARVFRISVNRLSAAETASLIVKYVRALQETP